VPKFGGVIGYGAYAGRKDEVHAAVAGQTWRRESSWPPFARPETVSGQQNSGGNAIAETAAAGGRSSISGGLHGRRKYSAACSAPGRPTSSLVSKLFGDERFAIRRAISPWTNGKPGLSERCGMRCSSASPQDGYDRWKLGLYSGTAPTSGSTNLGLRAGGGGNIVSNRMNRPRKSCVFDSHPRLRLAANATSAPLTGRVEIRRAECSTAGRRWREGNEISSSRPIHDGCARPPTQQLVKPRCGEFTNGG